MGRRDGSSVFRRDIGEFFLFFFVSLFGGEVVGVGS